LSETYQSYTIIIRLGEVENISEENIYNGN